MHHHDHDQPLNAEERAAGRVRADRELAALGFSRRQILAAGASVAAASALGAAAVRTGGTSASAAEPSSTAPAASTAVDPDQLQWLVGDHHVHTQWSHDAKYLVRQQLDNAEKFGCDWLVFTEHSNFAHADKGVFGESTQLSAERKARDLLIFQGLEWYVPAAEHATVIVHPGEQETKVLRAFELTYDGKLNGWEKPAVGSTAETEQEQRAVEAIAWLGEQRRTGQVADALVLANHPMRLGIDSPHEMRKWRDADPEVMIGMEGAPGAQGSGVSQNATAGDQRGEYTNTPRPDSFPGYTEEMMRPYGGFDWMSATVGGLWDSMLAEGKPFFITTNSDIHLRVKDTWRIGDYPNEEPYTSLTSEFDKWAVLGKRPDPVDTGKPQGGSDYWPGEFSRIHAGATERSYAAVMAALRAGRVWVDHGHLLQGFDVRVRVEGGANVAPTQRQAVAPR